MARNRHGKKYEFDVPVPVSNKPQVLGDLVATPEDLDWMISSLAKGTQLRITPAGKMIVSKIPVGFTPKRRRIT